MPDRIPILDDWGHQVGEFIPSGEGCEAGLALAFAFVVIFLFGFVFYAIYKLIVHVIQEAREGRWGIPILLTCIVIISVTTLLALQTVGNLAQKQYIDSLPNHYYCPKGAPSKLSIGMTAHMANHDGFAHWYNSIGEHYSAPGYDEPVTIVSGPACSNTNDTWWLIDAFGAHGMWIQETWGSTYLWIPDRYQPVNK